MSPNLNVYADKSIVWFYICTLAMISVYCFTTEQKLQLSGEEQEKKISTYEEAMSKIKDATGVSDIQVLFHHSYCFQNFYFIELQDFLSKYTYAILPKRPLNQVS